MLAPSRAIPSSTARNMLAAAGRWPTGPETRRARSGRERAASPGGDGAGTARRRCPRAPLRPRRSASRGRHRHRGSGTTRPRLPRSAVRRRRSRAVASTSMTPWLKPSQPSAGSVSGASLIRLSASAVPRLSSSTPGAIGAGGDQAADMVVPADAHDAVRRQAGSGGHLGQRARPRPVPLASSGGSRALGIPARLQQRPVAQTRCSRSSMQRARREAVVGRALAAQPPGEIVADVQPVPGGGERLGRMALEPHQLEQAEGRVGAQSGDPVQPLEADRGQEPVQLAGGARVVPGDDRAPAVGRRRRAARRPRRRWRPRRCGSPWGRAPAAVTRRSTASTDLPETLRVELGAVGPRSRIGVGSAALATTVPSA